MGEPIRAHMTWHEYQQLPEDRNRYEVLEGLLMMSPAPGRRHQHVVRKLIFLLELWRMENSPSSELLPAPFDVVLSDDIILQPDLVYVSEDNLSLIVDERLCGAPDLAVEIFNAKGAARDRVAKLQIYAKFGVREYWLVDLDARTITMLSLVENQYEQLASGTGSTKLASRVLPGFELMPRVVFEGI
jgi:Uma2 family endonuclease